MAAITGVADEPAAPVDAPPQEAQAIRTDWKGVLALAERLSAQGKLPEALSLLDGMSPDDRRRPEIAFARAVLLIDLGRAGEAESILASLIDAKPNVTRIRLEHGRALAAMGHYGSAERELRRALADDPPATVVASVDAALRGIRANRRLFGTASVGIAPDTNINQATSAEQIHLFGLPFEVDPSARRKSGIGVLLQGEIGVRRPLSSERALVVRVNGSARIYPSADIDDLAVEGRVGLEQIGRQSRITPELTYIQRWYAGHPYASGPGAGIRYERRLSKQWFGTAVADIRYIRYNRLPAFDGMVGSLRLQADRALNAATALSLGITTTRTGAKDAGYASWLGELDASLFRDWKGAWSTSISGSVGRLTADAALEAFGRKRNDWRWRGAVSVANRRISWLGLMPMLRISHERYASKIALYDLGRTRAEILLTRTF